MCHFERTSKLSKHTNYVAVNIRFMLYIMLIFYSCNMYLLSACTDDRVYDDEGTMNSQVYDVLCGVLGGNRFVQRNVYSPYYYKIGIS